MEDSAGYNCTIQMESEQGQGQCSHLRDCVLPSIANDEALFRSTYFCPIQSRWVFLAFKWGLLVSCLS